MYKHILLTTELLKESAKVEEKAAFLQKCTDAKLSIIHVIEPMPMLYPVGESILAYDFQEISDQLVKRANESLLALKNKLAIKDVLTTVKQGNVSDEILDYAKKNNVDLIITGSHGKHGVKLLLGSTANAVLHGTEVDVISVRINDD